MSFFNDYEPKAIQPGYVAQEGDYEVMILGVKDGTTPDGAAYKQVVCKINYPGEPHISLFLTEGRNFDGQFTAFCDTFGIIRGDQNFQSWTAKRGWIHINLTKKDGFTNMVPRWILDERGYVKRVNGLPQPPAEQQQQPVQQQQSFGAVTNDEDWGDIPF